MIEFYLTIMAFCGFGMGGDAEEPYIQKVTSNNQQIIRVIDSVELKGFNNLEAHDAETWFV